MTGQKLCWDSCIAISALSGTSEKRVIAGIRAAQDQVQAGQATVYTSIVATAEVLNRPPDYPNQATRFINLFRGKNTGYEFVMYTPRVGEYVRQIREYYVQHPEILKGKRLSIPDAIHLASAICIGANVFYTTDSGKRDPDFVGLLKLPMPIAGKYLLSIVKPDADGDEKSLFQDGADSLASIALPVVAPAPPSPSSSAQQ